MRLRFDLWFVRDARHARLANLALLLNVLLSVASVGWYLYQAEQLAQAQDRLWQRQAQARTAQSAALNKPVLGDDSLVKATNAAHRAIGYDWNLAFGLIEQGWPPGWLLVSFEHNAAAGTSSVLVEKSTQPSAIQAKLSFLPPWEIVSIENRIDAGLTKTQVRLRTRID
jgi:hypothetical protein